MRRAKKAITFIELLFVTLIIGILIGISLPQFKKTVANLELENFTQNIYALSRYLQASAVAESKIYCLNINPGEGKLWATYKDPDEFKGIAGKFGKIQQVPPETTLSLGKESKGEKLEIYFYPDGSVDEMKINFKNKYDLELDLAIQHTGIIKVLTPESKNE